MNESRQDTVRPRILENKQQTPIVPATELPSASDDRTHVRHGPHSPHTAGDLHRDSLQAIHKNQLQTAIGLLQQAINLGWRDASEFIDLGLALYQQQRFREARICFELATQINTEDAIAANCLGMAYKACGDFSAAIASYERAVELQPEYAEAYNNKGNALRDQGLPEQALACYRQAITCNDSLAAAHNNMGVALFSIGQHHEARDCYERALICQSDYPEALNNLGNALRIEGRLEEALNCFQRALDRMPESPQLLNNIGVLLRDQGKLTDAIDVLETALKLHPEFPEAFDNLGTALLDAGQFHQAISCYERAALQSPDAASFRINLGNAYRSIHKEEEAIQQYQRALQLEPNETLHLLRSQAICPAVFARREELETRRHELLQSWRNFSLTAPPKPTDLLNVAPEPPFNIQFFDGNLKTLKTAYADIFRGQFEQPTLPQRTGKPRIGIVVTRTHEGIFLKSMSDVLRRISLHEFDVVLIAPPGNLGRMISDIGREEIQSVAMPSRYDQMVETLVRAELDVVYYWEVGTDAGNYFLPFTRVAPIQCTSWGVQVTSGIPTIDYYLSSAVVEVEDAADHYSESLRLASTLLTYRHNEQAPIAPQREKFGFGANETLYVCAQNVGKIHPDFDGWLAGILRYDGNARVVITVDRHSQTTDKLQARLSATIADVAHRVTLLPRLTNDDYLQLLATADVLLDPPHFGGVNSTFDGLRLNRPIVTLPTRFHRGRYTAACLRKVETLETIVSTPEDYVAAAVRIANDADLRQALSERIQVNHERLFNDNGAVSEHERLFRELIQEAREHGQAGASQQPVSDRLSQADGKIRARHEGTDPPRPSHAFASAYSAVNEPSQEITPETFNDQLRLACVMSREGRYAEAIQGFEALLRVDPEHDVTRVNLAKTLNNLANQQRGAGNIDQACSLYALAAQHLPNAAVIQNNYGNALRDTGRYAEAREAYQLAIEFDAEFAEAIDNLGTTLSLMGARPTQAEAEYRRALKVRPDLGSARFNLANVLVQQDRIGGAEQCYRALAREHDDDQLMTLRAATLCPSVFPSTESFERHVQELTERLAPHRWPRFELDPNQLPTSLAAPPQSWQYFHDSLRPIKEAYASLFQGAFGECRPPSNQGQPKVGFFVSAGHERAFLKTIGGIVSRLPVESFKTVVFCCERRQSEVDAAIARGVVDVIGVPPHLGRTAEAIREQRCDVLYHWEIGTDAINYFLPMLNAAPVQITSWGQQVTSGIANVDYYLSSDLMEPADATAHYSEELCVINTLPTYQHWPQAPPMAADPSEFGFQRVDRLYVCPHRLEKFHPEFDQILAAILRADRKARLVIVSDRHGYLADKLCQRWGDSLGDLLTRVTVLQELSHAEYLRLLSAAHVVLDTPYFSGANSTYDAFAVGAPVVTMPTRFQRGRYTSACYRKMGLSTCIASSPEEYVEIAIDLANNLDLRHSVRQEICNRRDVLFEDYRSVEAHAQLLEHLISTARSED